MYQTTKILDGSTLRLEAATADRRIRGVVIYNNSPVFLYVGQDQNPTRESAQLVIPPYRDVSAPLDCGGAVYVSEGPAIGPVPAGSRVLVMYGPESVPLMDRGVGRSAMIPVMNQTLNAAGNGNLTVQRVGEAGGAGAATLAIPATARRRTLYGVATGGNQFASVGLDGSLDGVTWFRVADPLTTAQAAFTWSLPDNLALPPFVRVAVAGNAYPVTVALTLGVDL